MLVRVVLREVHREGCDGREAVFRIPTEQVGHIQWMSTEGEHGMQVRRTTVAKVENATCHQNLWLF